MNVTIPGDMADALDELVAISGESRASVLRRGLGAALADAGLWELSGNTRLPATPTSTPKEI